MAKKSKQRTSDEGESDAPALKQYQCTTAGTVIDGKKFEVGEIVEMSEEDAQNHRERGIGLVEVGIEGADSSPDDTQNENQEPN